MSSPSTMSPSPRCSRRSLTPKGGHPNGGAAVADAIAGGPVSVCDRDRGHSYIASEEMFWRAGGLVPIYPILDPGLSLSHGAWRSNLVERTPGYIDSHPHVPRARERGRPHRLQRVRDQRGDHRRRQEGKRLGATVIGVTSTEFAARTPPDHPPAIPAGENRTRSWISS